MADETVDARAYQEARRVERREGLYLLIFLEEGTRAVDLPRDGTVQVGREPGLPVVLDDKRVSRRHARVEVHKGHARVTDLGSRNGTEVAGQRLEANAAHPLRVGDALSLGGVPAVLAERRAPEPEEPGRLPWDETAIDPGMQRVVATLRKVARGPLPVLILGETGVGKELVAQAIHGLSERAGRPFLALNCAALPEGLLESELFGHEKGAFTSATATKQGLLEAADGGTVLLDEVGELTPAIQAKLLRVLEDHSFVRVGATERRTVDVRVLAATNRDLGERVGQGLFRQDLLFRLNAITFSVPPLRERPAEIGPLCQRFARNIARQLGRAAPRFEDETLRSIRRYRWPGNIRELRNVVERAVVLCDGSSVRPDDLPDRLRGDGEQAAPAGIRDELRQIERQRIVEALEACGWNQTKAAVHLGMPRRTLVHKIKQLAIKRPR